MDTWELGPDITNDRIFRKIDSIVERIHQHAVEPLFSMDVKRRSADLPSPAVSDEYVLKHMIILIAFSEGVQAKVIDKMVKNGVFDRVFVSYDPKHVANLDPETLVKTYWDNPSKPTERLAPLYKRSKLSSMVGCAKCLLKIAAQYGSFMQFIEGQKFPNRIDSRENQRKFWEAFDSTSDYLANIGFPFFRNFTSLCHLLQDLGFDCAKPDSIVMGVAERLGIVGATTKKSQQRPLRERKKTIQIMQMYSIHRSVRTPVVDLYFLIYGGQTDAKKFVEPAFYSL
jgi:3-methyladenine DNA glycosylase Tag